MTDIERLDANLLTVFDALLIEPRLSHACELLGVSATAMSTSLARLRAILDDPIVLRSGKSVSLSPKAEEMRPLVREAIDEIHRTLGVQASFDPSTSRRLFSIVASDYALGMLTSPLLTAISADGPGISLAFETLSEDPAASGIDLLRHDVVIAAAGRTAGQRRTLWSDDFVCVASAQNPRLRDGTLSLDDLRELGHVVVTFGESTTTPADQALAHAGIIPRRVIMTRGFTTAPYLVSGTDLVALVPSRLLLGLPTELDLVVAETPLPSVVLDEAAHWNPGRTSDPALQWLLGHLQRIGAALVGGEVPER
ncbi:LysR substrate-binding domain-containing protein [Gordonia sp. NPDC003424]